MQWFCSYADLEEAAAPLQDPFHPKPFGPHALNPEASQDRLQPDPTSTLPHPSTVSGELDGCWLKTPMRVQLALLLCCGTSQPGQASDTGSPLL